MTVEAGRAGTAIHPSVLNPGDNLTAFQAKLHAKLFSNVQLFYPMSRPATDRVQNEVGNVAEAISST